MDINHEYAAHQTALMQAEASGCSDRRKHHFAKASHIAGRISAFQLGLGAAASCAWSAAHLAAAGQSATHNI